MERISNTEASTTILLIDGIEEDRTFYADRIKLHLPDCVVLEAKDGKSGFALYHSRRIDCIVTELYLSDMSAFELLEEVVPFASQPEVAVVILTRTNLPALAYLAKTSGAQAVLVKRATAGDDLLPAIQKAMAAVGPTRKDRPADA